jgi:hypothetical protein
VTEAGSSIVVESGRTCRPLRSDEATPGKWQTVKPAISKDVPTGKLQTYRPAIVDSIKDDIIGRRGRGSSTTGTGPLNAASAVPPAKRPGQACHGSFIYFPFLKPARAGNKIQALKLIK